MYNLTSAEYQAKHTQEQMVNNMQLFVCTPNNNGVAIINFGVGAITIGARASDNSTIANVGMSFDFANGNVPGINPFLVVESEEWKIANFFITKRFQKCYQISVLSASLFYITGTLISWPFRYCGLYMKHGIEITNKSVNDEQWELHHQLNVSDNTLNRA